MVYWLALAASELRRAAGRKMVHVAAQASVDQSTIYRFEQGSSYPQDPDMIIEAYAGDLDIDAPAIWRYATDLWQEHLSGARTADVLAEHVAETLQDLRQAQSQLQRGRGAQGRGGR